MAGTGIAANAGSGKGGLFSSVFSVLGCTAVAGSDQPAVSTPAVAASRAEQGEVAANATKVEDQLAPPPVSALPLALSPAPVAPVTAVSSVSATAKPRRAARAGCCSSKRAAGPSHPLGLAAAPAVASGRARPLSPRPANAATVRSGIVEGLQAAGPRHDGGQEVVCSNPEDLAAADGWWWRPANMAAIAALPEVPPVKGSRPAESRADPYIDGCAPPTPLSPPPAFVPAFVLKHLVAG